MEVILLERVARLGDMGDVAEVKNGFARNYLIPQGKAMRATAANKAEFETRKAEIAKINDAKKVDASKVAKKLEGVIIELVRQASDDGRLYGSVTVRDIGLFMEEKGFEIPRQNLLLERAIKEVGSYEVTVAPHPEIEVVLPVRVARNESEFLDWEAEEAKEAAEAVAAEEAAKAAAAAEKEAKTEEAAVEETASEEDAA